MLHLLAVSGEGLHGSRGKRLASGSEAAATRVERRSTSIAAIVEITLKESRPLSMIIIGITLMVVKATADNIS